MPPSPAASAPAQRPPGRYGERTPSRRGVLAAAVVLGLLATAGLAWVVWGMLQPQAEGEVGLFEVTGDDGVELVLEVTRPAGSTAVCTIEALGAGFAQVGLLDVTVEPATTQVTQTQVQMATSEEATVAVVRGCRLL